MQFSLVLQDYKNVVNIWKNEKDILHEFTFLAIYLSDEVLVCMMKNTSNNLMDESISTQQNFIWTGNNQI